MCGIGGLRQRFALVVALLLALGLLSYTQLAGRRSTRSAQNVAAQTEAPASPVAVSEPEPTENPPSGLAKPPEEAVPESDGGEGTPTGDSPVMRFVYFIESDEEFQPESLAMIEQQAVDLQAFWYEQFGGTFRLANTTVDVVYGDHPAEWYDTSPIGDDNRWYRLTNIDEEVQAKLGVSSDDHDVRLVTYPSARIDGRVGANRYEGAWLDGDDITCIGGGVETTPYTSDFPANCLATAAHELGHVYGLGHEGADEDCMQFGFYQYVSDHDLCDFTDENRAIVVNDPLNVGWLDAQPGDRG